MEDGVGGSRWVGTAAKDWPGTHTLGSMGKAPMSLGREGEGQGWALKVGRDRVWLQP